MFDKPNRDSSWIPQFNIDVKTASFYSITIWAKPTSGSKGMPRYFFPHLRLISRLAKPFLLLTVAETKPLVEDQMDFIDYALGRNFVRFTASIDYRDW